MGSCIEGSHLTQWEKWLSDLPVLESLSVPTFYKPVGFGNGISCQLHNSGYGVVTYLRLVNSDNQIPCSIVMSKARVAPLKKITVPRMALTAAPIAVKVNHLILEVLECYVDSCFFLDRQRMCA